jgi:hypothetical protein
MEFWQAIILASWRIFCHWHNPLKISSGVARRRFAAPGPAEYFLPPLMRRESAVGHQLELAAHLRPEAGSFAI